MAEPGVCSSKALKYFGCKLHTVVSLSDLILGFLLTAANRYDNQPVMELLDSFSHHLQRLLEDGAYNDAALESYLQQYRSSHLLSPAKGNQTLKRSLSAQKQLNRLRLICETVNAQLQEQLHLSKHYAQSVLGGCSPNCRQGDGSQLWHDGQLLFGSTALQLADLAVYV